MNQDRTWTECRGSSQASGLKQPFASFRLQLSGMSWKGGRELTL